MFKSIFVNPIKNTYIRVIITARLKQLESYTCNHSLLGSSKIVIDYQLGIYDNKRVFLLGGLVFSLLTLINKTSIVEIYLEASAESYFLSFCIFYSFANNPKPILFSTITPIIYNFFYNKYY